MMYSANYFVGNDYAVGYATATHPLGPFRKSADNPVLQKMWENGGEVTGTGHNMVLSLPDGQKLCVYTANPENRKKTGRVYRSYGDKGR